MKTGRYIEETTENGQFVETVRFDPNKNYTTKEKKALRKQFLKDAKAGKTICLTDLMIIHGM